MYSLEIIQAMNAKKGPQSDKPRCIQYEGEIAGLTPESFPHLLVPPRPDERIRVTEGSDPRAFTDWLRDVYVHHPEYVYAVVENGLRHVVVGAFHPDRLQDVEDKAA